MKADVLLRLGLDELEWSARGLLIDAATLSAAGASMPAQLPGWSGFAAQSAGSRFDEIAVELRRLSDVVRACGQLLSAAVTALRPARTEIVRASGAVSAIGVRLQSDGRVLLPPMIATPASTSARLEVATAAEALARAALAAAAEADRQAAQALSRRVDALRPCPPPQLPLIGPLALLPPLVVPSLERIWLPDSIPAGGTPWGVAAWWSVQSEAARRALIASRPELIGATDGMPMQARHEANMSVLRRELARAARLPHGDEAARRLGMLLSLLQQLAGGPDRRLITLDVDRGRAAIAVGDVDSAAHVAILMAGLNADVTNDMDGQVGDAARLRAAAEKLGSSAAAHPAGAVAAIAWMGYRTPGPHHVAFTLRAKEGGRASAAFVQGIETARRLTSLGANGVSDVHVVGAAHSYGSVTLGYAMRSTRVFDDAVILGSPGTSAQHARELRDEPGHVYVAEAKRDPIADLAHFGTDPSSRAFGAQQLQTDGGVDPITGEWLHGSSGHSDYFESGGESLRNIAAITIGRPDLATYGDMQGAGDVLRWAERLLPVQR